MASLPHALEGIGITYRQYDYWASNGWLGELPTSRQGGRGVKGGALAFTHAQRTRIKLMAALVLQLSMKPERAADLLDNHLVTQNEGHVILLVPPSIMLEVRV